MDRQTDAATGKPSFPSIHEILIMHGGAGANFRIDRKDPPQHFPMGTKFVVQSYPRIEAVFSESHWRVILYKRAEEFVDITEGPEWHCY